MATFNQIFEDIQSQLGPLAEKSVKEFSGEAKQDAEAFLEESRAKLKKWVQLLAEKKIDKDEFRWLVESQKSLAKMEALRTTNAGAIRVERFRDAVLNVVVKTAGTAVGDAI